MKFGFTIPTEPDPRDREPLRHTFEVCASAESLGFDFGVVSHHRFTTGYPLSPWVALGAIAARTSTLRLGTSIMLLPLDHPLDVAEEVATVDQISGGRVFLGAGLGYRAYEYEALELPYHRRGSRMSECLEIVQRAWTEDSFSFHGEHFTFDNVSVVPKPVQAPRPSIWLGANSDAGIARAARLADGWMAGFADRLEALTPRVTSYRQQAAAAGRDATLCLMRLVGVGVRRADIEQNWLPGVVEMMRGYRRAGAPGERNEAASKSLGERREPTLDTFEGMLVGGTPEECIEALRRCEQATGCESVLATFRGPEAAAQLDLFGREVLPAFA